jgi:hypothetical protein
LNRYAAKLLYQFRIVINGKSNKKRNCEEKIILIKANNSENAYKKAIIRGKKDEHNFLNNDGNTVFYEFIGIMDLMHLGIETEEDEVWYEVKAYLKPKERKSNFIPKKNNLSSIRYEKAKKAR